SHVHGAQCWHVLQPLFRRRSGRPESPHGGATHSQRRLFEGVRFGVFPLQRRSLRRRGGLHQSPLLETFSPRPAFVVLLFGDETAHESFSLGIGGHVGCLARSGLGRGEGLSVVGTVRLGRRRHLLGGGVRRHLCHAGL